MTKTDEQITLILWNYRGWEGLCPVWWFKFDFLGEMFLQRVDLEAKPWTNHPHKVADWGDTIHRDTEAGGTWEEQTALRRWYLSIQEKVSGEEPGEREKVLVTGILYVMSKKHRYYYVLSMMRSQEKDVSKKMTLSDFALQLYHYQCEGDAKGARPLPGIVFTLLFILLT